MRPSPAGRTPRRPRTRSGPVSGLLEVGHLLSDLEVVTSRAVVVDARAPRARSRYKNKRRIKITPEDGGEAVEFLIPKGKHISVHDGDSIRKGEYIIDGNPDPHDILRIQGIEALADFLVNEIQEVYRLQGVRIDDKHIEVIVRQMLQKVRIEDPGDTNFLKGSRSTRPSSGSSSAASRARAAAGDLSAAIAWNYEGFAPDPELHLLGFVPGDNARAHRGFRARDDRHLRGLKENVIVGRLIPRGRARTCAACNVSPTSATRPWPLSGGTGWS